MAKKKVFQNDVDIPQIVQKKADIAFSQIKKEGNFTMKTTNYKKMKPVVKAFTAVAACAVLIVGVYASGELIAKKDTDTDVAKSDENIAAMLDKMFTLEVNAEELEAGQPVSLMGTGTGDSWVLSADESGSMNYCMETAFSCKGENIESITYEINKGAFQIVQPKGENIILSGTKYEAELNTGSIGAQVDDVTGHIITDMDMALYQSFTVAYDKQSAENTWISICNEVQMTPEDIDTLWAEERVLEDEAAVYNKLFDGVVITCTIHYTDGTSQNAQITVGSKVMTYAEAGQQSEHPELEDSFLTFELQQEQ